MMIKTLLTHLTRSSLTDSGFKPTVREENCAGVRNMSDNSPDLSPDGQWITFISNRDGDFEIYIADVNGNNLRQLTANDTGDYDPVWSPDGQWIAFYSFRDGPNNSEIYVMDRNGANVRRLTDNPTADDNPSWR